MRGYKRRIVGNDVKKCLGLYGHLVKPGEVHQIVANHDDWCRFFKHKPCNCDPDIKWAPTAEDIADAHKDERARVTAVGFIPPKIN